MADDVQSTIPVVDFSALSLDKEEVSSADQKVQEIADQICDAFSNIGFVYLKNHGISNEEITKVREVADRFFALPVEEKQRCARPTDGGNHGWVALERESLNPERPADLKEAFNIDHILLNDRHDNTEKWPTTVLPEMQPTVQHLYELCSKLSLRVLKAIGTGLKKRLSGTLQNPNLILERHNRIGTKTNSTALRLLYYPPIPDSSMVKKDQIRCGEHSDYGSITLLFQDDLGGLQVLSVNGGYINAPSLPGCVIVNIGDLMQRWTADRLKSTKHRVLIPADEVVRNKPRRSFAFFVHPDDDGLVECLDGSNKYPGITGGEYLKQRFAATYKSDN